MTFTLDQAAWASPWRQLAVADKVLLTGVTLAAALLLPAWPVSLLVVVGLTGAALTAARVPWRTWLTALTIPFAFVLIGVVSIAVQVGPVPVGEQMWWQAGFLSVTEHSVIRAATTAGRAAAGACAVILLAVTTPVADLVDAGRRIGIPGPALDIVNLMYRMLFVLADSATTMHQAQAARLGHVGFRRSVRSFGTLAGHLLARSWARATALEAGLAGRGYTDQMRTLPRVQPHSARFLAQTCCWVLALIGAGVLAS